MEPHSTVGPGHSILKSSFAKPHSHLLGTGETCTPTWLFFTVYSVSTFLLRINSFTGQVGLWHFKISEFD